MNNFYVGQKVVCIKSNWKGLSDLNKVIFPIANKIYTIREFDFAPHTQELFIRLEEIANPINKRVDREPAFLSTGFRPLIEKKTDISIFTDMLIPNKVVEKV